MVNEQQPVTRGTLGITGLTMNAMALIAPGAFLWLTFQMQSLYGAPMAGISMWFGILFALLLCFATAISYSELAKLYPGPGSSYLYAEQAFLSKTHAYKFARLAKFITGWASHLYYWVYPGVMVGVTAILGGFLLNQFWPDTFSGTYNSPLFMYLFCIVFALGVAYIAYRGVTGTTAVNVVINIVQISALLVFSVIAIGYRVQHPQGSTGFHLSNGTAVNYQVAQEPQKDEKGSPLPVLDDKGKPTMDKDGKPVYQMQDAQDKDGNPVGADKDGKAVTDPKLAAPFTVDYSEGAVTKDDKGNEVFNYHKDASSVIAPHGFNFIFIQAAIAILILVGFESVTSMGEEAKRPTKDIPRAVLLSLAIQGAFCYLIEYFAANYMMHNGYTMPNAGASGAPIGDMMVIAGTWLFGSYAAGKAFMLVQAFTVFLALIGTTLSCLSTGARVTYAMGRDEEVPSHFGLLHGKNMSPHRAIWTLAVISAIIGISTVLIYLGGQSSAPAALDKHNFWYSFGIFSPEMYTKLPNTLVIVTLISNFGTFLLYMITCIIAMVAFK
ncbi:MAG TPA: APC family permease, partial [Nitrospirota bacterium]|nr:APC family permease [Nitrospirota bacterium]